MRLFSPLPPFRCAVALTVALELGACAGQAVQAPAAETAPITSVPVAAAPATPVAAPLWSEQYGAPLGSDVALRVAGSAPLEGAAPILNSGLSFAGLDQRLQYSAGYQVNPGDLLNPAAASNWRADALPQSVSSQTVNQQLKLKLDTFGGAPVYVGARYQQQDALMVSGSTASAQQAMDVNWAPAFATVHLNWMPEGAPVDTTQALQCERSGQVSVPLAPLISDTSGGRYIAVDARARACRVSGDDPALNTLTANTWSTGLRWGRPTRETALRLQSVTPGLNSGVIESDRPLTAGSGYEVRVSQQRTLGEWQAQAGIAYRKPPLADRSLVSEEELLGHSPWATSAELRRNLAAMSIAASWQRGDAYWFLPDVRQQADTFALSVNFAPWSTALLGAYSPTMAMSYNWVRADSGSTRDDDQAVNWNVSFPWR